MGEAHKDLYMQVVVRFTMSISDNMCYDRGGIRQEQCSYPLHVQKRYSMT